MDAGQRQRRSRDVLRARQSRLNLLSLRVNARLVPPLKRAADRGAGFGLLFAFTSKPFEAAMCCVWGTSILDTSNPVSHARRPEYLVLMITLQLTLHNTHRMNQIKQNRARLSVEDQRATDAGSALLG